MCPYNVLVQPLENGDLIYLQITNYNTKKGFDHNKNTDTVNHRFAKKATTAI